MLARTLLFVPGHRADRFDKALRSGADAVVFDLEDSVPASDKPHARAAIANEWSRLQSMGVPLMVRINAAGTQASAEDLAWFGCLSRPAAVLVPKIESAETLLEAKPRLGAAPLLPIIESAAGLVALPSIAAVPGVARLAIGHLDFMADLGMQCGEDQAELVPLRFAVAMATRSNDLGPPVDSVTAQFNDDERLRADVRRALRCGFTGKLCIHPRQIAIVHEAMAPSAAQLEWARRVVAADAAAGGAAVQVDGQMVDRPVVLQARRILASAPAP